MQLSRSCSKAERLLGSLKIHNLCFSEQLCSLGGFCEFPSLESLFLKNCSVKLNRVKSLKLRRCDLNANSTAINSETSSSAIVDAIPRDLKSLGMLSSLVRLSLEDNSLSNECFLMDFSSLSMLSVNTIVSSSFTTTKNIESDASIEVLRSRTITLMRVRLMRLWLVSLKLTRFMLMMLELIAFT
nr:hypothetical protein [Tanacetum cinerariifolium]